MTHPLAKQVNTLEEQYRQLLLQRNNLIRHIEKLEDALRTIVDGAYSASKARSVAIAALKGMTSQPSGTGGKP